MSFFRNLPIKRKLSVACLGMSCLGLFVTCVSFLSYESFTARAQMAKKLSIFADGIGRYSVPSLTTRNPDKAHGILAMLTAEPEIATACLYTADGKYFEGYSRHNASVPFPQKSGPDGGRLEGDQVVLFRSITGLDGKRIGTVYLESTLPGMVARFKSHADLAILALGGSLLLALGFSYFLQRFLGLENIEEMKKSIREQAALLDKTQDAIFLEDLKAGVRYWNQSAVKLYGWTVEEAEGRRTNKFLFSGEKPEPTQAREETLQRGEWVGEMTQITRDKAEIVVESRWTLIPGEDGKGHSILHVNSNITERKKLESQFLQAQRLDSIGCMAGGIAHDLNNLLAPILMGVSLLRDEAHTAIARSFLDIIEASAQRGADILKHVLTFARGSGGDRKPIQIQQMIREMAGFIRETFPRNIVFDYSVAEDLRSIKGDATQIHQILMNLCVNSRDAMPYGGTLFLEASNQMIDSASLPPAAHALPGPYVSIKVSDSGSGIKAEIMDKIFDPFFTTKEVGEGTGLGLSVVFGIVKSHGGYITVESEPGKGTTMQVFLPAFLPEPVGDSGPSLVLDLPVAHSSNGELVMIVDDEPSICRLAATILRKNGYHVLLASDGAEAVRMYNAQASVIQLVITDVMMPFVDGVALVKALQAIDPAVNIIASTGQTGKSQQNELLALGVSTFLKKPYTPDQLLESVSQAIR